MTQDAIRKNNEQYWNLNADHWFGTTALPNYAPQFVTETDLALFGDVSGKKMLEIGCGSGHSIKYHADCNAGELWGLDISRSQIENAKRYLSAFGYSPKLICSPMEEECGIPTEYFDIAYSIYAIGWTTDLDQTFEKIASYLKPDGVFIFSWKHPIHFCTAVKENQVVFEKCYFDESWFVQHVDDGDVLLCNRKISTYVNALAKAGFCIEQMIEQTDAETMTLTGEMQDKYKKAQKHPLSFVFKARKMK